ncbi:hypothetical protein ANN_23454 [Periplaneta americana]|uniref:Uncharacterized protein n=1 Tax=Periplaneta americana TaxID=6978 RepID=A0ABQ8SLK6_PERAM|nr:hypothetical protein ANN_23454 [Periplaneta americana]
MGNACCYSVCFQKKNLKAGTYKIVTGLLPVVLNAYETWTLTLREEQTLRLFENEMFRKIFGAKKDEEGEWRKLHNACIVFITNIIGNFKSRRLRLAEHVARMGIKRYSPAVLISGVATPSLLLARRRQKIHDMKAYINKRILTFTITGKFHNHTATARNDIVRPINIISELRPNTSAVHSVSNFVNTTTLFRDDSYCYRDFGLKLQGGHKVPLTPINTSNIHTIYIIPVVMQTYIHFTLTACPKYPKGRASHGILQIVNGAVPFLKLHSALSQVVKSGLRGGMSRGAGLPPLPATLAELRRRINTTIRNVSQDMLERVWQEWNHRLDVCRIISGTHIDCV